MQSMSSLHESIKINNSYLSGHVRALCPGCWQNPQSLTRLAAGGSSVLLLVVVVVVVVV